MWWDAVTFGRVREDNFGFAHARHLLETGFVVDLDSGVYNQSLQLGQRCISLASFVIT